MNAIIIYWSKSGNTEKVALAIEEGLKEAGVDVLAKRVEEAGEIDFYAYDLVCIGFPSYQWSLPKPVEEFLSSKFAAYRKEGRIKLGCPIVPGKNALIFCTYSGPHTGIREAIPAGCTPGSSSNTLASTWWVNGTLWASFMGQKRTAPREGLGISRVVPIRKTLQR